MRSNVTEWRGLSVGLSVNTSDTLATPIEYNSTVLYGGDAVLCQITLTTCYYCGWFGSSTPSQKYAGRSGRGEVVCSFPTAVDGSLLNNNWREQREMLSSVKMYLERDALIAPYKFMFQKPVDRAYGERCLRSSS